MQRQFTGFHMLAIMLSFFAVVVSVNVTMAVMANRSWSGLVVPNSYVASQQFNAAQEEARAQKARGWQQEISFTRGRIEIAMRDRSGAAISGLTVAAKIGHPVASRFDREVRLTEEAPGKYAAAVEMGKGVWDADVNATAPTGEAFRLIHRITVN